jgi:predicted lipoprotein with Yx(FWY)xxD motif
MTFRRARLASVVPFAFGLAVLSGCGSSSSSSSQGSSTASSTGQSTTSTAAAGAASAPNQKVLVATKHSKLGTILAAGPKRLTVYLFEADRHGNSSCSGECAKAWPPVLGSPHASGKAASADLGTIKRADGQTQVTYKGHPLYYFIKDKDDGDAYGQGAKAFGADWYVLAPSGKKIDES